MTRKEAIKLLGVHLPPMSEGYYGKLIDAFCALGMLKIDEPKCASERAVDAMFDVSTGGMLTPRQVLACMDAAGLKIVEK
jgi:hypothetical protein